MKKLDGRWALVTGSSRGVGRQVALGLAEQGCSVIVHGRELGHLETTLKALAGSGVDVKSVAGDLATRGGVDAVIKGVRALNVPVDILYNNAAIMNPWKPIWEIEQDDWERVFQVNVYAPIELCRAFAPAMKERGFGRIINLTSGIKDTPPLAPYSVSKAAVDKYSRDLAAELKDTNVLVNYLDPGWLKTDMGGPNAMAEVEAVLPGALVPALLEDNGPSGQFFYAGDYRK